MEEVAIDRGLQRIDARLGPKLGLHGQQWQPVETPAPKHSLLALRDPMPLFCD